MLWVFDAGERLFQSGWFVESLATQTLVIFIIRTRCVPFFRSRPSLPLLVTSLASVAVAVAITFLPLGEAFDFVRLPWDFFVILVVLVMAYLGLAELGKARFFRAEPGAPSLSRAIESGEALLHKLAARWSRAERLKHRLRAGGR